MSFAHAAALRQIIGGVTHCSRNRAVQWLISNNCQNGVDGLPEDEGDVVLKIGDVIATCENIKQNYEGAEQN